MYNTITGVRVSELPYESRVLCLQVSNDGCALATACWDFNLRIFA